MGMPLPPMTETEKDMARLVSELTGIPYDTLVNETIEDAERRNNYKNKPLDSTELPEYVKYGENHHTHF